MRWPTLGRISSEFSLPWMARLLIDVQLEVLIIYQKTSPFFVNRKVSIVTLSQQIHVVTMR